MSDLTEIISIAQFDDILKSNRIVVSDFYAEWCGPCKEIAPLYEKVAHHLSTVSDQVIFTKVNVDTQKGLASKYNITAMPTFIIFKQGEIAERIVGADTAKVQTVFYNLMNEVKNNVLPGKVGSGLHLTDIPRGYNDVTGQIDLTGLELLNADSEFGSVRVLFEDSRASSLEKEKTNITTKDWVESDTDEQLMLFIPFQSTLKTHSIKITSLPPKSTSEGAEVPMRPKTIQIYPNRAHILGFDESEQCPATQTITLSEKDWNDMGTATLSLRFVKFQSVSSLTLFIVDGDGEGERTRIDRIRIIGEIGEKRDPGKLERMADE
ncbi:hypothetical protein K3495_g5431 [Podosphaera aphanis]|nr:hypothetical protein K3495_g5431 [Podosphaera aphanis]